MTLADTFIKRFESSLSAAIGYLRSASSYLTPKDDWVEGLRRRLALKLHPFTSLFGRDLVACKGTEDHCYTVDVDSDTVERIIDPQYQRNLTSTRKYRVVDGNIEWADASYVFIPNDNPKEATHQHHVYLFDRSDGQCDVYAHREYSAEHEPYLHVTEEQTHGDPNNRLQVLFDEAGISYTTR